MPRRPALILLLCLLVGLATAVWLLQEPAAPPLAPTPTDVSPVPAAAAAGATLATTPAAAVPDPATNASDRLPATAPSRTAAPAVIVGRCVDEHHAPLSAAKVRLHTYEPGGITKTAPIELQTGADGRFEFSFAPLPEQSFYLNATAEGRIGNQAHWPGFTAGERFDCGAFKMARGIVVRGNIEDTNHAPVADVLVEIFQGATAMANSNAPGRILHLATRTGTDGTFASSGALPEGDFLIRVHCDQQPAQPVTGTLTLQRPVEVVRIVVPAFDPREWITGTVVDPRGNPVQAANVDAGDGNSWAMTSRDGRFRLRRSAGVDPERPVQLRVRNEANTTPQLQPEVAWGSTEVELRLPDGTSLELRVRDQEGRPVPDFKVTLGVDKNRLPTDNSFGSAVKLGPFVDGIAKLPGVRLGPCGALLEFGPSTGRPPQLLRLDLIAQQTRIDVRAEPIVERTLEVVDGSGQPVVGVPVLLCDPVDGEFLPGTEVVEGYQVFMPFAKVALQLQTTTTDALGRAVLRGPGTRALGVRLPGPGHEPTQRHGVSLAEAEPLRIEVSIGAHLVGKVGPRDAVDFLRGLAGDADAQQRNPLRLEFARHTHDPAAPPPPTVTIAADGSFEQHGLLPGTYLVSLQYWLLRSELLGEVTLAAGRTTRFDAEIPVALMTPGTLAGRVMKNGLPAAGVHVSLLGTSAAVNGRTRNEAGGAQTDANGRFRVNLRPGSYRASVHYPVFGVASANLQAAETALVQSRVVTEQDFTLATGTLQVTLRSATGSAVPDVTIFDTSAAAMQIVMLPPTDTTGSTAFEVSVGTIHLRTLPKHLQSAEARNKVMMQGGWAALDALWIPLGTAEVAVGSTTAVELRLPADWDR
ncbi:MAG: carboxypeptidase-like regulatory domain-containing protein [Planctomycetes bacterium]|jgi:protocatechuate 3,4-dioxygenase beta subunit|nr:carboxypeptidase-like regulatory domain-containing protein [Planctomycetota bacterium]